MEAMFDAMPTADIEKFKETYKDYPSVAETIDGYLEIRVRREAQEKAKADFAKKLGRLLTNLPHPEDIHNIYMRWAEVEEPMPDSKPEEVEVAQADGSKVVEIRQPMHKVNKWLVELNKGFTVGRVATTTTNKRAVTLHKRNGLNLEFVGNFTSASKACEYLKVPIGGDSATRVLNREGYILDAYAGTDFLA